MHRDLKILHDRIDECQICASSVRGFVKPQGVDRGSGSKIMFVGEGPGNDEYKRSLAFAGAAGRRLDSWLSACGADPDDVRKDCYLSSVIKCFDKHREPSNQHVMIKNCSQFLFEQIALIKPSLIITLGKVAYEELAVTSSPYKDALCQLFWSEDHLLVTRPGIHYYLMPWPHPSPRNRLLNDDTLVREVRTTFAVVRRFLETRL